MCSQKFKLIVVFFASHKQVMGTLYRHPVYKFVKNRNILNLPAIDDALSLLLF